MFNRSETWYLGQKETRILQITERAMVRNMCGIQLMDKIEKSINADIELE